MQFWFTSPVRFGQSASVKLESWDPNGCPSRGLAGRRPRTMCRDGRRYSPHMTANPWVDWATFHSMRITPALGPWVVKKISWI